jgi:antitoxin HicB
MTDCRPPYSLRVFWSDEDGGFIAESPEFEGVSAFGSSYQEAVAELGQALDLALEVLRGEDAPIPDPFIPSTYSGQFRLRLPRSLHAWLAGHAELEGVSLNTLVVTLLADARGGPRSRPYPSPSQPSLTSPSVKPITRGDAPHP